MDPERMKRRSATSGGNTILEFAIVMTFLLPMFAGAFSMGMAMAKGIQAADVSRDAVILMVESVTDPDSGLNLANAPNQQILIRAADGLGMNTGASNYTPNASGNGVVILTQVTMVGQNECINGVIPAPTGAPPFTTSNCANLGQYVYSYRVVIGNGTRWSSKLGSPNSNVTINSNGTISANTMATNTNDQATTFATVTGMTLTSSTFALVAETFVDVSYLNFFSILPNPTVLYARNIS